MIAMLRGKLVGKEPEGVVVDVQGVGYAVLIPLSTYDRLPREGEEVSLYTHLHVREDALQLFGFVTREERRLFLVLMGVSGIGPKLALNVLSGMQVDQFCACVTAGDLKSLTRLNGIGKRLAERLIVELRDKVADLAPAVALGAAPTFSREAHDAIAALVTLGTKPDAARRAVRAVSEEPGGSGLHTEELIRRALAQLNRGPGG